MPAKVVTLNSNQKRFKLFKSTKKSLKKKVVSKKKKYTLKKKKLNIIYKNFCLENSSLLCKLYRKVLKKKISLQGLEAFLKLKIKLNKLNFIKTTKFFGYIVNFINLPIKTSITNFKRQSKKFYVFGYQIV